MHLPIQVSLPFLWGGQTFQKDEWGSLNFLVGPNGTGKTLFAEQLVAQCRSRGLTPRYLNAERLIGLEKTNPTFLGSYGPMHRGIDMSNPLAFTQGAEHTGLSFDAFFLLKDKLDVRVKLEAALSQLLGRRIRLAEEGGFLKPKVQRLHGGDEYALKENESHGLKELITLLTFLYDDSHNCLIIDEPELHLHPQFQSFFLQETRRIAGDPRMDPSKKCFFLITHSPYFIDIRTTEDLRHCVVFHQSKPPAYVDTLRGNDEWKISRLLPRLNTHHKQFFFATRPIFVEGYFDQQLFTLIQEKRDMLLGASGASIIDVSGKEELDLFYRLCKKLKIDAQFISDLDVLTQGNLRQSVSQDDRCRAYLQAEGLSEDLMKPLGDTESLVSDCIREVESKPDLPVSTDADLKEFIDALIGATEDKDKRYVFLLGLRHVNRQLKDLLPTQAGKLNLIEGRLTRLIKAFEWCGVYLLPHGELENHLPGYTSNPYKVTDKAKQAVFKEERDRLLSGSLTAEQIRSRYKELVTILDRASLSTVIDTDRYLSRTIGDWIHKVQSAFHLGGIGDVESLKRDALVEWSVYSRIIDVTHFSVTPTEFSCIAKLKPSVDANEREVKFSNNTVAANFKLQLA